MKRTINLILIFLFAISFSYAQRLRDAVYLKNGSIIRGSIIENKKGEYVKIETSGESVWVFKQAEIDTIKIEVVKDFKRKGYFNVTSLGFLVGQGAPERDPSLTMINGYQLNSRVMLGVGVGVERLAVTTFPLFAELRYNFLDEKFSSFATFQFGYHFPDKDEILEAGFASTSNKGSLLLGGELGIRNYFNSKSGFIFALGFRHQKLSSIEQYQRYYGYDRQKEVITDYNRFTIRIGFIF